MNPTRIYAVTHGDTTRLIRAVNAQQATRFAAQGLFEVKVATQDALVELIAAGVKVESATEAKDVEA